MGLRGGPEGVLRPPRNKKVGTGRGLRGALTKHLRTDLHGHFGDPVRRKAGLSRVLPNGLRVRRFVLAVDLALRHRDVAPDPQETRYVASDCERIAARGLQIFLDQLAERGRLDVPLNHVPWHLRLLDPPCWKAAHP